MKIELTKIYKRNKAGNWVSTMIVSLNGQIIRTHSVDTQLEVLVVDRSRNLRTMEIN